MDIRALVSFLTPFLPYLLNASEEAAKEAGKRLGEATWETARAVWHKLRPKIEARPAAQEAAQDVAADPDNPDTLAALRVQLKKLLAEDLSLAQEIAGLMQTDVAQRVIAKGTVSDVEQEASSRGRVHQEVVSQEGEIKGVKQDVIQHDL